MRTYPINAYERKQLKELNAEPWMQNLLKLNSSYPYWGPGNDYMCKKKDGSWDSSIYLDNFSDIWELDELNEVVNFYFEVFRESKDCDSCDRLGVNPETKQIHEDFYDFENRGTRWCDNITQDEFEALVKEGRIHGPFDEKTKKWAPPPPECTVELVNEVNRKASGLSHEFGCVYHDAINRWILIKQRAKRLEVYGLCKHCKGKGYIYTKDKAQVSLGLWVLHPRKSCSRGVEINNIQKKDLPKVFKYLKKANDRNTARFKKVINQHKRLTSN